MSWFRRAAIVVACVGCYTVSHAAAADAQGALQGLPHRTTAEKTSPSGAHGRYSSAAIDLDPPDLGLATALLAAGGGPAKFDANAFIAKLAGNPTAAQVELAALDKRFGAAKVASFVRTFDFVASDALAQTANAGMTLPASPATDPDDSKALAAALYAAGTLPNGRYDAEYMLDALMSHIVHVAVMNDIDANPQLGPSADADYHAVLAQLVPDMKKTYGF